MTETLHISSAPPARTSANYVALRERGMEWIRAWAKDSWTDHNVHDPGITMLEAFSYSMTEMGLRLGLDVADLLKSGESHAAAELEPAHRVLPMAPVNAQDLRRVLLDHPMVSDAQIFEPADNEVPFYRLEDSDPPFTYAPGTERIRPSGLYEVLVELQERELNTNTYEAQVPSNALTYDVEFALPFWDDPEAAPFRQPVVINSVAMIDTGGAWRTLPEPQSYFGRLNVAYTDSGGTPGTREMWVLLRITTPLLASTNVPLLLTDTRAVLEAVTAGAPMLMFAARTRDAAAAVDTLRTFLEGWRNLGEQAVRIGLARLQDIAVRANIEVTGGADLEALVARIFIDIDKMLSPRIDFESLAERLELESDPERIYDGPLLRRGFPSGESLDATPPAVIYTSDILRIIMRRRSDAGSDLVTQENPVGRDIVAVTDLTLANFINNRVITADAEDCLHLVEITRYRPRLSLTKSRLITVRNDSEVTYDPARVQALFDAAQLAATEDAIAEGSPVWPVTLGEALPIEDYTPIQNELPANYGVGESELPDSAGPERHAAVKQLQGYLFPLEQMLADMGAQLGNINRFYSGSADEGVSSFVHAPFDVPGAQALLRRFPQDGIWTDFVALADNPVVGALQKAAESRERLLDRRNRMLDHLLARQGEDAVALVQEMHRWARAELVAAELLPTEQDSSIEARRDAANARLVRLKAAMLRETPELAGTRLLANSNPFMSDATLLRIEQVGDDFRWFLSPAGVELLRTVDPLDSAAAAGIAAERAFNQAGRQSNYVVVDVGGGQRRLRLFDGSGVSAQELAESSQSFASVADANAALPGIAAAFANRRIESSLSPMERRIAHHTGIRGATRRRSLNATNVFFEIFDEPAPPGLFRKRWRLRGPPTGTGPILLVSADPFDAATDPLATAAAEAAIRLPLRYGMDEWNYGIDDSTPFTVELRDPGGVLIATSSAPLATEAEAASVRDAAVELLYRNYSGETLYLVEHVLLRPRRNGDPFLSLPATETERERDPYSQRVSLVFPSGSARDFTVPPAVAVAETTPDRFRDPEFRRHVAGMVQRACPAHLMPTIYWVDRQAPGTANSPASFDTFEARYFAWLDTVLIPGAAPAAVETARNELLATLQAIANDAA